MVQLIIYGFLVMSITKASKYSEIVISRSFLMNFLINTNKNRAWSLIYQIVSIQDEITQKSIGRWASKRSARMTLSMWQCFLSTLPICCGFLRTRLRVRCQLQEVIFKHKHSDSLLLRKVQTEAWKNVLTFDKKICKWVGAYFLSLRR